MKFLQNAAMMNHAMDQMDAVVPIGWAGDRTPVAEIARAMQKVGTYNNIQITNSQVGVVSTGDLARIDAAITLTKESDVEAIGQRLQAFAQAVLDTSELTHERKKDLIDLVQALSEQIVSQRKEPVIKALGKEIVEKTADAISLSKSALELWEAIRQIFGG